MFSFVSSFVASKASGDKSASLPTTPFLISTLSSNISSDKVQAKVWADAEMYGGDYKAYHIKSKGRIGPFPDFLDPDNTHHLAEHYYFGIDRMFAEYDVRPIGSRRQDDQSTIGQVWNRQLTHNACRGKCLNKEIAIEYEYDLRASWEVHITLDKDENLQLYCDEKFQTRAGEEELKCQFCGMSEEDIPALQQQRQANKKPKPMWGRRSFHASDTGLVEQIKHRKAEKLARIEKFKNSMYRSRPVEEEEDSDDEDVDEEDELDRCVVM
ncbi:hypothetical protein F5876DRAFT_65806 [Lentinula aff. lateritia]|uniref:Uncharacterized protein n=1 Tax=Lentinula aff. lateritia TaxID=2804960 RepID=A0ACC1U056_9AGAR|nr:hypothetical protein F5876DRAFT_65806 [Lentinula aff. lateritia]